MLTNYILYKIDQPWFNGDSSFGILTNKMIWVFLKPQMYDSFIETMTNHWFGGSRVPYFLTSCWLQGYRIWMVDLDPGPGPCRMHLGKIPNVYILYICIVYSKYMNKFCWSNSLYIIIYCFFGIWRPTELKIPSSPYLSLWVSDQPRRHRGFRLHP